MQVTLLPLCVAHELAGVARMCEWLLGHQPHALHAAVATPACGSIEVAGVPLRGTLWCLGNFNSWSLVANNLTMLQKHVYNLSASS
jgi:hypothetical protein